MKGKRILILTLILICSTAVAASGMHYPESSQDKQKDSTTKTEPAKKDLEQKACGDKEINFSVRTDKDQHPTPAAPTDKALVYVIRPTMIGMAIQTKLAVDGHWLGANRGDNYFFFTLEPGEHDFCSQAENRSVLTAKLEAGKTYYFQQKMEMGLMKARSKLVLLDSEEGKKGLAKCYQSISEEKK